MENAKSNPWSVEDIDKSISVTLTKKINITVEIYEFG